MRTRFLGALAAMLAVLSLALPPAAAAAPSPGSTPASVTIPVYGHRSTTNSKGSQVSPNEVVPCGSATLKIIDVLKTSFVVYWQLNSTQGNIMWENWTIAVTPGGGGEPYDGPGPILSATTDGDFTVYNRVPGTFYTVTWTGSFDTDNATDCAINAADWVQM